MLQLVYCYHSHIKIFLVMLSTTTLLLGDFFRSCQVLHYFRHAFNVQWNSRANGVV